MLGRAGFGLALAIGPLLAACTVGPVANATPTPHPRVSVVTSLHLLEADDAQTLDPALIDDPVSLAVGSELFEGLTRLDASHRPVPGLADRWEVSDGGRTYTLHLRHALYASGATVKASDALDAWSRALAFGTNSPLTVFFAPLGARSPGDPLPGVRALDQTTLRVTLPEADSSFLTLLSLPPYWLYDPKIVTEVPAGSGPYRVDRWEHGRRLQLRAVDGYWGASPVVRQVEVEVEPDAGRRVERFRAHEVDIVHGLTGPQALAISEDPAVSAELHRVPTGRTTWLGFNTIAGSGYGPQERMAIAQAIDRKRLTDLALWGSTLAEPATDFLPPGVPGHRPGPLAPYDTAAARQGLDQAGFAQTIDIFLSTNATVGRVGRDLQDQLTSATGRTVVLHPIGDFFNRASLDQLPLFIDTWSADFPYPSDVLDNLLRSGAQFNAMRLDDPAVDAALDQGRHAATFDDAIASYQRAEVLALADNRVVPLYSGVDPYLVQAGLRVPFEGGVPAFRWEDVT